jgi:superfamily II DNA or RNA helicase
MKTRIDLGKEIPDRKDGVLISVGNVYSSIVADREILDLLKDNFAYEVEDAAYIRDAKIKFYTNQNRIEKAKKWAQWNGKFSVFNHTRFGTGIVSDVMMFLEDRGYDVSLVNNMELPVCGNYTQYKTSSAKELLDYQKEAFEAMRDNHFRGILQATVAFGKTVLASYIIEYLGAVTVIIVDRKEIMKQWEEEIDERFDFKSERIKGASGRVWYTDHGVPAVLLTTSRLIMSVMSNNNPSKNMKNRNDMIKWVCSNSGLVIYDEVHHAASKQSRKALSRINAYYRIGLSGTTNMRDDNSDYEYLAMIGNVVHSFTSGELIGAKRGAPVDIFIESVVYDPEFLKRLRSSEDYNTLYEGYIVDNERRNEKIIDVVLGEIEAGNSVLVLVDRVRHARNLSAMLGDLAVCTWSQDEAKERVRKIKEFKSGVIPALFCTYSLAGEGFDFPELSSLVLAGGKSEIRIRQSIGRIMRLKDDGSHGRLFDFADVINPFKDHLISRIRIYNSEEVFTVKKMPNWVRKYV